MINFLLFSSTVLIWGTSWLAIAWQIGPVDIIVSIFYRFALAFALLLLGLASWGRLQLPSQWRFILLQGLCLFSLNFVCLYNAASLIPSGLVSVVFSLAAIFNAINSWIFFAQKIRSRTFLSGGMGAAGLALLFGYDLDLAFDFRIIKGMAWAIAGTFLFSLGNMMSRKNQQHGIRLDIANLWGMGFGALVLCCVAFVQGLPFAMPDTPRYLGALFYLSVIGSVLGFHIYLSMLERLGADRAAYATVLFPIVALMMSTLLENYAWHPMAVMGIALTLLGNLVMFAQWPIGRNQAT